MNAPAFTGGEWKVHTGTPGGAVAVYCEAGNICTLRHRQQSQHANKRDRDQTIRDAVLLAAAPELFNALTTLANAAESLGIPVDAARAALAKAAP